MRTKIWFHCVLCTDAGTVLSGGTQGGQNTGVTLVHCEEWQDTTVATKNVPKTLCPPWHGQDNRIYIRAHPGLPILQERMVGAEELK